MSRRDSNFILIATLAIIPIAIYWGTISTMVGLWSISAFRHSYLIPFVSLFLLWRDRLKYETLDVRGSWIGIGCLAALVALWIVAESTSVQQVEQMSVVLMVSAFVLAVIGREGYRRVWFPLAFLLFAVPIGSSVVPQLMDSTATIAVAALQMFGVPALREGMLVSLPGGTFEVVEACSGFSYLNAGVSLGVLVAYLMFRTLWKQVCYVLAVVGVFVLVNGIRAFIVMFVASTSRMQLLAGKDHVFFGWVLFLLAMVLMYWVAEKFSDATVEKQRAPW